MPKWKQHYDKPFQLYHLSERDLDGVEFQPRSIDKLRALEGENWKTKRICVADSISGALNAIGYDDYDCIGKELYIHVPENLDQLFQHDNVYKPSLKQVPDSQVTGEFWLKAKAKMKKVGKLKITKLEDTYGDDNFRYYNFGTSCWVNNLSYVML